MAPEKNLETPVSATSQPSKSSEIVASDDDLLIQILLKLPLKPLMKFTSVSKHWLSLISGPDFCHRRNPSCCVSGLFIESPQNITELEFVDLSQTSNPSESFTFFNNSSQLKIIHACNGLWLCSTNEAQGPNEYYVNNPTTYHYAILPPLPFRYRSFWGLSLAFDPSKSSHYKVVCVLSQIIDDDDDDDDNVDVDFDDSDSDEYHYFVHDTQIVIYSSETETWRLSGESFYVYNAYVFSNGVFWNGSLHWLEHFQSVYFNVDEERRGKVLLPPVPDPDELAHFVESGGHLYLIYQLPALPGFDIYEMEMNYSGWFLKFRVDLSEFPAMFLETFPRKLDHEFVYNFFEIVHIVSGDVDEEAYAVVIIPGMVIRYNFTSKAFDKLCDIEAGKGATRFTMEWVGNLLKERKWNDGLLIPYKIVCAQRKCIREF